MTNTTQDPVQGLIDFVTIIKPYHTKIVEVSVEHEHSEKINTTISDVGSLSEDLSFDALDYNRTVCGSNTEQRTHGDPFEFVLISPDVNNSFVGSSPKTQAVNVTNKTFIIAGDQRQSFYAGDQIEAFVYVDDYSPTSNHSIVVDAVIPYQISDPLSNALIVSGDVTNILENETYYVYGGWVEGEKAYKVITKTQISSSPNTYRLVMDTSTLVTEESRNKNFGLYRQRVQLSATSNIFTIGSVEFNVGTRDSWPGFDDYTTYQLGNVPHTIITVVENIDPQPPYASLAFDSVLPNLYFSGHLVQPSYAVIDIITSNDTTQAFVTSGDQTARFFTGKQFYVEDSSCDGVYTTYYATYAMSSDQTTIYVAERNVVTTITSFGTIYNYNYGMNNRSPFRSDIPHNNVECFMSETLEIELDPPYTWTPPPSLSTCPAPDVESSPPPL